jgi:hypothetical protein
MWYSVSFLDSWEIGSAQGDSNSTEAIPKSSMVNNYLHRDANGAEIGGPW